MYLYNLKLYLNSSENSDLIKKLSNEKPITGQSRTAVDILNPVIDLVGMNVNKYNYCYVEELQRYYYIENVIIAPNGIYRLQMHVDVLMTYKDDILESSGLIRKNSKYNPYAGDYEVESRYDLTKHEFQNGFDFSNGDFILVTMRG